MKLLRVVGSLDATMAVAADGAEVTVIDATGAVATACDSSTRRLRSWAGAERGV